jgi:hypothetical protein
MEQPGLDGRHRDKDGETDQKHGTTLNKNLDPPIREFPEDWTLDQMRIATGKTSEADVREAAKKRL